MQGAGSMFRGISTPDADPRKLELDSGSRATYANGGAGHLIGCWGGGGVVSLIPRFTPAVGARFSIARKETYSAVCFDAGVRWVLGVP